MNNIKWLQSGKTGCTFAILLAEKVLILGNVARDYIKNKTFFVRLSSKKLTLIHPSKRNYSLYIKNKHDIITSLKNFI